MYTWSRNAHLFIGHHTTGVAATTPNIDSAYNHGSSGDAFCVKFVSPVTQSSATLKFCAYVMAVTGTPDFQMHVRNGAVSPGDVDRPEASGSAISSSPSTVSMSGADAGTWVEFTCTVSLTAGVTYWVLVTNTSGAPISNYATFRYSGTIQFANFSSSEREAAVTVYTTNGFSADGTTNTNGTANTFVLKFADGTYLGNPYVTSSTPASAAEDRGIRFVPLEDLIVSGICFGINALTSIDSLGIYEGSTTIFEQALSSLYSTINDHMTVRFAPVRLKAGHTYDVMRRSVTALTHPTLYEMGEVEASVPADVLACRPPGWAYVSGSGPGSYTADTSKTVRCLLWADLALNLRHGWNKRGNKQ